MQQYDDQFNLRKRHPFGKVELLKNMVQSHLATLTLKHSLDVSYGKRRGEKLDIFPAASPNAPVFVFIHGGYFRSLDKKQYRYIAKPLVKAGCTVVLVNYDLAPSVNVATIVEQNIRAFDWIYNNISRWHGNQNNIVLCGHSVGAFLVAKILEQHWSPEVKQSISAAVLLSGIYDLTKIKQSYLNSSLKLSDIDVTTLSPMFGDICNFPHALIAVGENETDEFIEQSQRYAHKLNQANSSNQYQVLKGKHHYTVARMLSNNNSLLVKKILRLCGIK